MAGWTEMPSSPGWGNVWRRNQTFSWRTSTDPRQRTRRRPFPTSTWPSLIGAVAELVGERTDVVLLNDAPVSLAYRVVRDGEIILCRDDRARAEHKLLTITKYIDMEPMRRTLAEGLRHRIEEGRFGRR